MLASEQLLEAVQPGLLSPYIGPLRSRIRKLLEQGGHSADTVTSRVQLQSAARRPIDPDTFSAVVGAVLNGRVLEMEYHGREKGPRHAAQLNQDEDEEFVDASGLKGKIDHSTSGAQFIWEQLSNKGMLERATGQILALCIVSHHSGLIDCLTSVPSKPTEDGFSKFTLVGVLLAGGMNQLAPQCDGAI